MTSYIYALCCPDTQEIRYIGKANEPEVRLRKHLQAASSNPENYAQRWMAKLLMAGKRPLLIYVRKICAGENWQEIERGEIAKGFAQGLRLTNTSAGGEGVLIVRPEVEARRIANTTATWQCPELRKRQAARVKEWMNTPESKAARRELMLERWKDPEYAAMNSQRVREAYSSPEARKAQSLRTLEANKDPEVVAKRVAGIKAAWADSSKKEEWISNMSAAQSTPEAKARQSAQMKAFHQDPEFVARRKARMADPEMIKRRNAAISASKQKKKAERLALQEDQKAAKFAATADTPYTEPS